MKPHSRLASLWNAVRPVIDRLWKRSFSARRPSQMIEGLESRQLLTTTITGTADADTDLIRLNTAGTSVEVFVNQATPTTPDYTLALTEPIAISALAGNDKLTVDFSRGHPIRFERHISFDGGDGSDSVELLGTTDYKAYDVPDNLISTNPDVRVNQIAIKTPEGGVGRTLEYANTESLNATGFAMLALYTPYA